MVFNNKKIYPKIINVKPDLERLTLIIHFDNGVSKEYNVKRLIEQDKTYSNLLDKAIFQLVKVEPGGYGVSWNEYLDLPESELWENGEEYKS
ncbi:DUF2442 domain-containing protein [Caldicellulosiruptoraceae bacterium PP1]